MGDSKEEGNMQISGAKDACTNDCYKLIKISERPFSDLTDSREEQFLLDEMMNVANMKNQIRKLKLAIDEKKAKQFSDVVSEMKNEIYDKQDSVINAYSKKVFELNDGYKNRKKDLYAKRELFERNVVSIQADLANYKKESDLLRKDAEVQHFIKEYNDLKNEFDSLVLRETTSISSDDKNVFRDMMKKKKEEIDSFLNDKKSNSSVARFFELHTHMDAKIGLVCESEQNLKKIQEYEVLINEKYIENVNEANEIRKNQIALVSQGGGLLGLKRLLGKLKLKLGIGKNKNIKEITAICDATTTVGKTIEIVKNNKKTLGLEGKEYSYDGGIDQTQAQIVNKLASLLFKSYATKRDSGTVIQGACKVEVNNNSQEKVY